ncbi:MAG: MFS transporter [Clostridiales Family XIII bacterium]|jgi:DHA3 family macrolide efflux protein-like MFS transporter|nr:MFS transporter [Clostridiales Family XIII bacterium]
MEINWKKNAALFVTGQALSLFGSMVVQYAILWHITLKTQSGTMMTVFTVAGFLPMFFISPFGGVWADRFNRKYLINIADGAIALASLFVAILLLFGFEHVGILLFCAIVRSFGQGVQMPAVGAFVPQIVPTEHLTRINGIQSSVQSSTALAAPVVSAALMSFAPLEILFFLDVLTAAVGISILFFFVKVPAAKGSVAEGSAAETPMSEGSATEQSDSVSQRKKPTYFHDLREGLRYIRKHRFILLMLLFSAIFMFSASPAMLLTPLQVARNFGEEAWRLAAIEIEFSVGMMLGGLLIAAWGGFKNRVFTISLACVLFGVGTMGLGASPSFPVYGGVMTALGLSIPFYNAPVMVLLQSTVDPAFMGRVLSVIMMINSVIVPVGMLFFGPMADAVSIDRILIGTGAVMALLGIPLITSKALREAGIQSP